MLNIPPSLATTALEEFWDTSRPIVFAGVWCVLDNRKSAWSALDGQVLASPWADVQRLEDAYNYVQSVEERVLDGLSSALNRIHGIQASKRYWRILIGPWVHWYVCAMYDRYITIEAAADTYPEFVTIGLADDCFVIPRDTLEFAYLVREDGYNVQLYTRILEFLGYEFPRRRYDLSPKFAEASRSLNARAVTLVLHSIHAAASSVVRKRSIVLKDTFFSPTFVLALIWRLRGAVWPIVHNSRRLELCAPDLETRQSIRTHLPVEGEFERLLSHTVPCDLPLCYIEQFGAIARRAEKHYPGRPKAIFSANAWYYDEEYKSWAAAKAEIGTYVLGTQHGANYGSLRRVFSEEHETKIADRYYSWGWNSDGCQVPIIPLPATRLAGRRQMRVAPPKQTSILFGATSQPRYLVDFSYAPGQFVEYLDWQQRFATRLIPRVRAKVHLRPHHEDMGWSIGSRWEKAFPEVTIQDWSISFLDGLERCRLFVCDHCSTTFAEALAANKPTILFWDPSVTKMRPGALAQYDNLRRVGILFDSPETAADAVVAVYDNISEWWNHPTLQSVRHSFCQQFARTSAGAVDMWVEELRNVYELPVSASR